jgi:hypothetical protein
MTLDEKQALIHRRPMKLQHWIHIMRHITPQLRYSYRLFRKSNWGESSNRAVEGVDSIDGEQVVEIMKTGNNKEERNILFYHQHVFFMERSDYLLCPYHNEEITKNILSTAILQPTAASSICRVC